MRMPAVVLILATVVVLGPTAALTAERNQVIDVNQSIDITQFKNTGRVTVSTVTFDFFPADPGPLLDDPAKRRGQFVRVAFQVTNTGKEPFRVFYTRFYLKNAAGTRVSVTSDINKAHVSDKLEGGTLAPGESAAGALYYDIGALEPIEGLFFAYAGNTGDYEVPLAAAGQ